MVCRTKRLIWHLGVRERCVQGHHVNTLSSVKPRKGMSESRCMSMKEHVGGKV